MIPETTLPRTHQRSGRLLIVFLALCVLALGMYFVRQRVFDAIKLWGYTPPSEVAALATEDTMNNYTRHVFYVNHPQLIDSVAAFRAKCPEDEENIILGCYYKGQNGIFIYNVQDSTLSGVQQVTAAHEVLHALYARLTSSARKQLDSELESYYKHGLHDSQVAAEIKIYQTTEPGDVYDEMSCTFGTEIASLPTALNNYYKQFFTDRQAIVSYEESYQGAFTVRQNEITADDQQLNVMKQQIAAQEAQLASQLQQINAERGQLENLESSDPLTYDNEVPSFNDEIMSYNNGVSSLQAAITSYNNLAQARNVIAGAFDTLVQAINTSLTKES